MYVRRAIAAVAGLGAVLLSAVPAIAAPPAPSSVGSELPPPWIADVTVDVSSERFILPSDGWTSVDAVARNVGTRAAAGVRLVFTLPAPFQISQIATTNAWDCDFATPTVTCDLVEDLAPGASAPAVNLTGSLYGAPVGTPVDAVAAVSTTTFERRVGNNTGRKQFQIVGKGTLRGVIWNDLDADGIRESGEPLVTGVGLGFWSVDDDDQYGFSNSHDGTYRFDVPAKAYVGRVQLSKSNWRFTTPNVGTNDAVDSDVTQVSETTYTSNGETPVLSVVVGQTATVDIGVVATGTTS
ncbi:SdrD B-like domain-containing protein [Micromonospora sp. NPDC049366]|uniref:SdrD B-like domain-containing protein n=1 Tax=Micromonospora sp. NPDC049366 TaxID=3364271 RepID=UPI003793BB54